MSKDDPTPEDIAGLFRKFGGDAHDYKEFAPPETEEEAPRVWPLLTGEKIERPSAPAARTPAAPLMAPVQPLPVAAAPQPRVEPVLRPLPVPAPIAAPAPVPAPAPAPAPLFARPPLAAHQPQPPAAHQPATASEPAPTPLSQLFERLAAPQPRAAQPGLMSRWRRPT